MKWPNRAEDSIKISIGDNGKVKAEPAWSDEVAEAMVPVYAYQIAICVLAKRYGQEINELLEECHLFTYEWVKLRNEKTDEIRIQKIREKYGNKFEKIIEIMKV